MSKAKKKGLFAFLLALLASAIVSGALLLSPATANAAAGTETADDGTVTISNVRYGNELFSAVTREGTAGQPLVIRFAENTNMEFTAGDNGNLYYQDESGQMQHLGAGNFVIYDELTTASSITLDLNGGSITLDTQSIKSLDVRGVDLTIMNGAIKGTASENLATSDSDITLENVDITFNYTPDTTPAGGAAVVTTANLTLADVKFTLNGTGATAYTAKGTVTNAVAKVGDTYYTDVKTAIESATDGQTVTLTDNATLSGVTYVRAKNVTLDLGNHTLTIPEGFDDKVYDDEGKIIGAGIAVKVYGSLTLTGGENGRIDAAEAPETTNPFAAQNGGVITVNSGTIEVDTNSEACIFAFQGGFVTINGGTLINRATGDYTWGGEEVLVVNAASNATTPASTMVQVNGGTFIGRNPAFGDDAIGGTFITEEVKTVTYTLDGQTYVMVYNKAEEQPQLPAGADPIGSDYFEGETLVNEVNSAAALSSVLGNVADEAYIRLGASFAADVVVPEGKTITFDLNGKTLTNVNDHTILNYGTLIITDTPGGGVVDNVTHARGALFNLGTATLLGGEYTRSFENSSTNSWYAIKNLGHLTIGAEGEECSVQVIQDGNFSSLITNGYYDADGKAGGDYDTYSGLVTTDDKLPTLTINGGTFRGGINTVKNDNHSVATINGGEFVNTTQATVLNWNELTINGGTFNADSNALYAVITSYDGSTGYNNGITNIAGGKFTGAIIPDYGAANVHYAISGGEFTIAVNVNYLGEGASLYTDGEGGYAVAPANEAPEGMNKVAVTVNGKGYSSIAAALEATEGEVEIKLYDDLVENVVIPAGKTVVLDLAGFTITNVSDHTIVNYGNLTIKDSSEQKSGVVDNITHARAAVYNEVGGVFFLDGARLARSLENGASSSDNGGNSYYVLLNHGTATLNGYISQDGAYSSLIENGWYNGSENTTGAASVMNIIGGEYSGGLNTVKNDDYGVLTISAGTFSNVEQSAVLNWNEATISGGTFQVNSNYAVVLNGYLNATMDKGELTITGGSFHGQTMIAQMGGSQSIGEVAISGGEFSNMPKAAYFEDGFVASWNEERKAYVTVKGEFVASIGAYSYATLQEAIDAATDGATVTLLVDIGEETDWQSSDGSSSLQFYEPDGKSVTIDFGGHTVYSGASTYLAAFAGTLTFTNGSLYVYGTGIQVTAYLPTVLSKVVLTDTFSIDSYNQSAVFITTNNNTSYDNLVAELETSADLTSWNTFNNTSQECWATIQGNGTQHGTKITINGGSVVNKKDVAIYHPQYGELAVNGGEIYGETTGIEMRAGLLTVNDGKITGNGDPFTSSPNGNGSTTVGAAVAVSQHSTNLTLNATINGGELNGVRALYEEDMQNDSTEGISLNVNGGQFNGAVESKNVKGFITGGRFAELPAEDAFAEGLEGELYNGYYVVVNASEAGTAATIADRLAAQNDLRTYLAAFGLTLADMEAAESDEFAAAVTAAYEEIFLANTKDDIATALAAAMDAVDAYRANLAAEKAAALTELTEYAMGAQGEDLAIVVVPTYAISAINAAVTADEIETYVSLAKAEMDDIRAQRAEAEQQYQAVNDRFDAIMQALGITGSAEEGYTSEVLDKLNGVIEALGITEADGAWSTDLLDGITRDLETANENIAAMQELLGTAADEATAQTIIGMIKATQNSVASAETNIKNAISTLSSDIQTKYDALMQAVGELPTDVAGALDGRLSELEGTVSGLDTTVGNLGTDIGELETAVGGLTTAQQQLTEAFNEYKTSVDTLISSMTEEFAEISAKLDDLPTGDELATALTNALSGVTEQLTAIKAEVDKIDGMDDTIIGSVSDKIDAAFASFTQTFNTAMSGINTKLDDLGSAVAALPDDADITALKEAVQAATDAAKEAGTKVDTLGTTLSGRFDSVDSAITSIDDAIDGLTAAQNAMNEAMTAFRSELNTTLSGVNEAIAAVKADVKALADTAAADKLELFEKLNALQTSADAIEQAIASLDGDSSADLSAISAELAALQTSLGDVADVVDEVALGNTNSSSSFAGIYVYLSAILVLAAVILIVLAVKKRR